VDEEDLVEIEFINPGPLFPNPIDCLLLISALVAVHLVTRGTYFGELYWNKKYYSNELKLTDASLVSKKN
jgi:hypothetical protein